MLHGDLLRIEHAGGTSCRLLRSSQGHAPDDDDDDDDDDDNDDDDNDDKTRQDAPRQFVRTCLHVGWLKCGTLCLIRSVSVLWLVSVSLS